MCVFFFPVVWRRNSSSLKRPFSTFYPISFITPIKLSAWQPWRCVQSVDMQEINDGLSRMNENVLTGHHVPIRCMCAEPTSHTSWTASSITRCRTGRAPSISSSCCRLRTQTGTRLPPLSRKANSDFPQTDDTCIMSSLTDDKDNLTVTRWLRGILPES